MLVVVWVVAAWPMHQLGVPSPDLFAGVLAGAAVALASTRPRQLPERITQMAMGIVGVAAGASISTDIVQTVVARPVVILGAPLVTIAITMAAGQVLRFSPHVNGTTATFASIAGGASGLTAMAREVGADPGIVGSLQYLRVLVVVITVPFVASLLGGHEAPDEATGGWLTDWQGTPFTVAALLISMALTMFVRFSASNLIVPLIVSTALTLSNAFPSYQVPGPILALGFAPIGLMVGLSLSRPAVRQLMRLMPLALVSLALSLSGCGAIALAMTRLIDASFYDAYLATTPGGLHAVVAFAVGSGGDVGLIITAQVARLFLAISIGAVVAAVVRRREMP